MSDADCDQARGRVIVTYGRSLMSLMIAQSLGRRGVEVIGCDDVDLTVLSFSRFVSGSFVHARHDADPHAFLDDLEEQIRANAPPDDRPYLLIPVFRELPLIAAHKDRFAGLITIAAPDIASINAVQPKDRLATTARDAVVHIPRTWAVSSAEEARRMAHEAPFPALIKPTDGVGGRGIETFKDRSALDAFLADQDDTFDEPQLIQEMVPGDDYCMPVLCRDGAILASMAYQNLNTFPNKGGAGALRETVDATPFMKTAETLMRATRWNGVAEIDFRWSGEREEQPYLIEVNARFWAGLFHSMESGVDFPWLLYQASVSHHAPDPADDPDIGRRTRAPGLWLLSAIEDVAQSDEHFSRASAAWSNAQRNIRKGSAAQALVDAAKAAGYAAPGADLVVRLQHAMRDAKDAPTEFSYAEDPLVGLGALFVLGSVMRHGALPPELTHKEPQPQEGSRRNRRRARRPVIGVTKPVKGDRLAHAAMRLAVWLAGGRPIKLTASREPDPSTVDGLVFGGGADVFPERYAGAANPQGRYDRLRDDMEARWAAVARKEGMPVLGVCRGAQMLNVLHGGSLHQTLDAFAEEAKYPNSVLGYIFFRKWIDIKAGSGLRAIADADRLRVNSIHKQAIDRLGDGLAPTAREKSGLIQGIEDPNADFYMGVQFHPEFLIHRAPFRRIFRAFVEAARRRAMAVSP